jgi:competence protein ComEA
MQRLLLALAFALASTAAAAALNLNTATKDELVGLPGIGPAKAQAILDYRKAHGSFKSVEELKDVKGIGVKRFEQLKGELTVGAAPAKASARADDKEKEKTAAAPSRSAKGEVSVAAKGSAPAVKP